MSDQIVWKPDRTLLGAALAFRLEHSRNDKHVLLLGARDEESVAFWSGALKPEKIVSHADQTDTQALGRILNQDFRGRLDIVVDNTSHFSGFEYLFPRLAEGALYILEDRSLGQDTIWSKQPSLTRLMFNAAALTAAIPLIKSVDINRAFAVVERDAP